jgi:hypothetical protein
MPDSGDVDAALSAKLLADDTAPKGKTKFVILSLINEEDEQQFQSRAYEDNLYLVKAVAMETTGANVKAAAARIDALLEGGTLTVSGYSLMRITRVARVRYTEVDDVDEDIRWQHRGGHYAVTVSA